MQYDFFPERATVSELDPADVVGERSRVQAVYVVRYEWEKAAHQVFHDRHGWYCADHGPGCRAVREVTARRGRRRQ